MAEHQALRKGANDSMSTCCDQGLLEAQIAGKKWRFYDDIYPALKTESLTCDISSSIPFCAIALWSSGNREACFDGAYDYAACFFACRLS